MAPTTLRVRLGGRLTALPDVAGVRAVLDDGYLELTYDPQVQRATDVIAELQRAGVHLAVRTHRLVVTDMHCASCAGAVERGLRRLPGVVDASLTFATEKCDVIYRPDVVELRAVKERIRDIGFGALEEDEAAAREQAHVRDLRVQTHRLIVAWVFGLPMLMFMVAGWFGHTLGPHRHTVMLALTTPLFVLGGSTYYRAAYQALRYSRTATTDVLISLGFSASFLYSVAAYVVGQPMYFDTSAMVITFVTTGKYLKVRATATSSQAVRRLVGLQARTARRWIDGAETQVPIDAIGVGDHIVVRAGERIPLDGTIADGATVVDESMLTGESFPVGKRLGDTVLAGTINRVQPVRITVERIGRETALAQIIRLLDETQAGKPAVLDLSDRISAVFVPVVLVIATLTFVVWAVPLRAGLASALAHAVAVLVIACPCAVSLAPGTAIAVATAEAARRGVLIKGAITLERLRRATVVVLDKTGTLTAGTPTVRDVVPAPGWDRGALLGLAAAAEERSEHPLADAIRGAATGARLPLPGPVTQTTVVPGRGIRAEVAGRSVAVGAPRFLTEETGSIVAWPAPSSAETVVGVAVDGRFAGHLLLADPPRWESTAVVAAVRRAGRRVVMLTGDQRPTAAAVAQEVGIDEVRAEVLPPEKVAVIRSLQNDGEVVAMIGDGLNDAAALAQADIGIAIGAGADVAAEASDLTLVRPDLGGVLDAFALSERTFRIIVQNFAYAFLFNGIGLPLAAAGFLNPALAALSMGVSSVAVVGNSLRLRARTPRTAEATIAEGSQVGGD